MWASMIWGSACLHLCQAFSMGQLGWQFACGCPLAERLETGAAGARLRAPEAARCVRQEVAGRQSRRLSIARIAAVNALESKQPFEAVAVARGFTKSLVARHS